MVMDTSQQCNCPYSLESLEATTKLHQYWQCCSIPHLVIVPHPAVTLEQNNSL